MVMIIMIMIEEMREANGWKRTQNVSVPIIMLELSLYIAGIIKWIYVVFSTSMKQVLQERWPNELYTYHFHKKKKKFDV